MLQAPGQYHFKALAILNDQLLQFLIIHDQHRLYMRSNDIRSSDSLK